MKIVIKNLIIGATSAAAFALFAVTPLTQAADKSEILEQLISTDKPDADHSKLLADLKAIHAGGNINKCDKKGRTALMRAVMLNAPLAACWLVAKGADVEIADKKKKKASDLTYNKDLLYLIREATLTDYKTETVEEIAKNLATKGTDPFKLALCVRRGYDVQTKHNGKPTFSIHTKGETLQLLRALGMQLDGLDTPELFVAAIRSNEVPTVERMLKAQPDLIKIRPNNTSILRAASSEEMVRALIAAGADAQEKTREWTYKDEKYYTTLLSNMQTLKTPVIQELIRAGAQFEHLPAGVIGSASPLHNRLPEDAAVVDVLVQSGIDPKMQNSRGVTPLQCAASDLNAPVISALLAHGVDPNQLDRNGRPMFTWLFDDMFDRRTPYDDTKLIDALRVFKDAGAKLMAPYGQGDKKTTLMHQALFWLSWWDERYTRIDTDSVQDANFAVMYELLKINDGKAPADILVCCPPRDGFVFSGSRWAKLANKLLAAGADPKLTSEEGYTSLMTFGVYDAALAKKLIAAGVNPTAKAKNGRTALHGARTPEVADVLIKAGADLNSEYTSPYGSEKLRPMESILSVADDTQLLAIFRRLIEAGAEIKGKTSDGKDWNIQTIIESKIRSNPKNKVYPELLNLITKSES